MQFLDYTVLLLTIILVLFVGYQSSAKSDDTEDFLSANHSLNKLQTGFSMAATDLGGSAIIATVGYCYTVGMAGIWWDMAAVPAFLLVGLFLAKKINGLEGDTVPEFLGTRYNQKTKIFAAVMHICEYLAALSAQFTISCVMLQSITGIDTKLSLIISMVLVVFLTSGGLRTVVNTDSLLFVFIIISLVLCTGFSLHAGGGLDNILQHLPEDFLNLGGIGIKTPLSWAFLCFLTYSTSQGYIQRMSAAKDANTARFSALFTAGAYLFVSVLLGLVGITAWYLIPGQEDTNTIYPLMLMHYLPDGFVGFGVAGVFAATVSTATSLLHAMTTITVKDIVPESMVKKLQEGRNVLLTKGLVIGYAAISLTISLFSTNIINLLYTSGLFYSTSVFLPMLLGLKWKWFTAQAAFVSMIGSVLISLLWEFNFAAFPDWLAVLPSNVVGVMTSGILMILVSTFQNRKKSQY